MYPLSTTLPLRLASALTVGVVAAGCVSVGPVRALTPPDEASYRIFETRTSRFLSLEELVRALAPAEVIFFGEFHDDATAHRLQLDLLSELARSGGGVLGLEMFERDVQPALTGYVRGDLGEAAFLREARPWSNYGTDYRPLVELARERGWDVVATNLPQRLAAAIAREGVEALDRLPPEDRRLAAGVIDCPHDAYWERFIGAMLEGADSAASAAAHAVDDPVMRRTYQAQCARDETMAETIATLLPGSRVLHVNGAFHSDFRLGIVPRLLRRAPDVAVSVITAMTVDDLRRPPMDANRDRADFLVFTIPPDPEREP